jgi:hypothetical protein
MLKESPLHPFVVERFRNAFGNPDREEGKDRQWSLRTIAAIAAVNVLINGNSEYPMVWVFDPHDANDGVVSLRIKEESQVAPLIILIQERVKAASEPRRNA